LRRFDPEKVIEVRLLPFVYKEKKLREAVLDYTKRESNWELRLCAAELLVSWREVITHTILAENEINDLPIEYYYRARILRGALEGIPGYMDWV
jgi:hypothetical protein